MSKTDFDNKLISFNGKLTSNKNQQKIKQKNKYGYQKAVVYQPAFITSELKKGKGTDFALIWNSKVEYSSKLLAQNLLDIDWK